MQLIKVPNKFANQIMKGRYGTSNLLYYTAVNLWITLIRLVEFSHKFVEYLKDVQKWLHLDLLQFVF